MFGVIAKVFVVVHPQQQLRQVRGGGVHLDPRHNFKEECGLPVKLLGDASDLCQFPTSQHQLL